MLVNSKESTVSSLKSVSTSTKSPGPPPRPEPPKRQKSLSSLEGSSVVVGGDGDVGDQTSTRDQPKESTDDSKQEKSRTPTHGEKYVDLHVV